MIDFTCLRAEAWIEHRAAGLSSAEALRLEDHLAGCGRCGRQAALLDGLRALADTQGEPLSAAAREVVIGRALRQATVPRPTSSGLRAWPVGAVLATAMVAAIALWLRDGAVAVPAAPSAQTSAPRSTAATLARTEWTSSVQPVTWAVAHAKITLQPQSSARWNEATRELSLVSGSVWVDVDPQPHQHFSVITQRFSVRVLGTRFSVSRDAVSVERGRVRVYSLAGRELAVLGAGERFDVREVAPTTDAASAPAQAFDAPKPVASSPEATRAPREDGAARLAEARLALANRQVALAQRTLDSALAQKLSPQDRAEAMSLRADCALVVGDHAGAVEAYLRVARAFAGKPAGENALFSAARLEMERGRSASAAQWLARYLERYPKGRFEKEAQVRLRDLNEALDHAP